MTDKTETESNMQNMHNADEMISRLKDEFLRDTYIVDCMTHDQIALIVGAVSEMQSLSSSLSQSQERVKSLAGHLALVIPLADTPDDFSYVTKKRTCENARSVLNDYVKGQALKGGAS